MKRFLLQVKILQMTLYNSVNFYTPIAVAKFKGIFLHYFIGINFSVFQFQTYFNM